MCTFWWSFYFMTPKKRVRQFRSCPQQLTPTFIEFTDTPTRQFPQKKRYDNISSKTLLWKSDSRKKRRITNNHIHKSNLKGFSTQVEKLFLRDKMMLDESLKSIEGGLTPAIQHTLNLLRFSLAIQRCKLRALRIHTTDMRAFGCRSGIFIAFIE